MKRALVTGSAGLIGSHIVDLLVREGWYVRALDNLEPQTHRRGKPTWINEKAEFVEADLRDRDAITAALDNVDIIFHQAAYGGYMPEITKFVPTPENAPVGGETVYGLTKVDQERLVLLWGKQVGVPTVALRYSCTYGPRQSIFNPYTGVIAIFCTRLLNGLPPVLYEDGEQTRDFSFVEDVARANLLAVETDRLDGLAVNIGSGRGIPIREIAEQLSDILEIDIAPEINGEFRPGEMRHLTSDTALAQSAGYKPTVDLGDGIARYIGWIRTQSDIRDYFSEASEILKNKGIVHRVGR